MKQQLLQKLRSRQGMSLSMALLLFLVCMAVASVVVTAATASAGRLSQMARMDQRYFSVTSAAGLLVEQMDGASVTVTYTKTEDGASVTPAPSGDFAAEETRVLVEAMRSGSTPTDSELILAPASGSYQQLLQVSCLVHWLPYPSRGMTLTLVNDNGDTDRYRLQLTCNADVVEERSTLGETEITKYQVKWTVAWVGQPGIGGEG